MVNGQVAFGIEMGWNHTSNGWQVQIFWVFLSWFGLNISLHGKTTVKQDLNSWIGYKHQDSREKTQRRKWLQSILQVQLRCWRPAEGCCDLRWIWDMKEPKGGHKFFQPAGVKFTCNRVTLFDDDLQGFWAAQAQICWGPICHRISHW